MINISRQLLALSLCAALLGCKKDSLGTLNLKDDEITLYPLASYQIGGSPSLSLSSDNGFVATAENGAITGRHVGVANVTVSDGTESKKIKVNVRSKINLFPLPELDFSKTRDDIIRKLGAPSAAVENGVLYANYSESALTCMYMFKPDGILDSVFIEVKPEHTAKCSAFLREHYKPVGQKGGVSYMIDAQTKEDASLLVAVGMSEGNILVTFINIKQAK